MEKNTNSKFGLKTVLLVLGAVALAVGGFALTKYLTRNTLKVRGGTITLQQFTTPSSEEPLE